MKEFIINTTRIIVAIIFIASATLPFNVNAKDFVVMIDAGHGGKDPGALGISSEEKDINLSVALLLGKELQSRFINTTVKFTRSTDEFIKIKDRMGKAKEANADLFISLHCNSADLKNPRRKSLSGTAVYVLGTNKADDNIELAMIENSAILLEDDYQTSYKGFDNSPEYYIFTEINQSKMMGKSNSIANEIQKQLVSHAELKDNGVRETSHFWLLLHSTMPAILIEMDFICNPDREKYLNSQEGQIRIAEAIANGIETYCSSLGLNLCSKTENTKATIKDDNKSAPPNTSEYQTEEIVYKIQFLSSDTKIPNGSNKLKGIKDVDFYFDGDAYKYTAGAYKTISEAGQQLIKIRKYFKDAFIIKTQNGKRIK